MNKPSKEELRRVVEQDALYDLELRSRAMAPWKQLLLVWVARLLVKKGIARDGREPVWPRREL